MARGRGTPTAGLPLLRPRADLLMLADRDDLVAELHAQLPVELAIRRVSPEAVLSPEGTGGITDAFILDGAHPQAVEIISHLRRVHPTLMIAAFAANDEAGSRCLDAGANQYVLASLRPARRSAHWRAIARHAQALCADRRIVFGDLVYDREARRVWCAGEEVFFTRREITLFDCLFWHAGHTVDRETLNDFVWHADGSATRRVLEVYLSYVRRKVIRSRDVRIETVRGIGYRMFLVRDAAPRPA